MAWMSTAISARWRRLPHLKVHEAVRFLHEASAALESRHQFGGTLLRDAQV